jgi:uncharacterized protein with PIN domain
LSGSQNQALALQGQLTKIEEVEDMDVRCLRCDSPFSSSQLELILPWERGNNPDAFWVCPDCGEKNIVYGYGNDEDD